LIFIIVIYALIKVNLVFVKVIIACAIVIYGLINVN